MSLLQPLQAGALVVAAVAGALIDAPAANAQGAPAPVTLADGLGIAARYRVDAIRARRFTAAEFWRGVGPFTGASALHTEVIGRSIQGREIRSVRFGTGPTRVLLWSQMHGDESTATMALADIFRFLATAQDDPVRERLAGALTVVFVPMLNPDGAERFQRQNAAGIDVNRDARALATPEARALKGLRDRLTPDFGFNLHDQNARTRAGPNGPPAAIALLAPAFDAARSYNAVRSRGRQVAAGIARALAAEIPGRVARYDDAFNPRAFGDLMQLWGASTVLIESGSLPGDAEKQRLRALNVAAILGALDAIATGAWAGADAAVYDTLPRNAGGANDLLLKGGRLVLPGRPPGVIAADVAINYDDPVARTGPRIREVGDLETAVAIDTLDATGLFLHPHAASLETRGKNAWLAIDGPARFDVRRGPDAGSELVRRVGRE